MKQLLLKVVIWSVVGLTSCENNVLTTKTKQEELEKPPLQEKPQNKSLLGRWQLTHYYMDSGGGNDTYQQVADEFVVEFRADSTIATTGQGRLLSGRHGNRFRRVDDEHIEIFTAEEVSRKLLVKCKATETELELRYRFCIEGCGEKYKAIQ